MTICPSPSFQILMRSSAQFSELKPNTILCFLTYSFAGEFKLACSEIDIFRPGSRHATKSCKPAEHVRVIKIPEFQSFVRCLSQFLKPGNRPSDIDFAVVQNTDKIIFNDQFVIKLNSSQFQESVVQQRIFF